MDRRQVSSHSKGGVNYQAGEFVELNDSPRTILLVERLEVDSKYVFDLFRNVYVLLPLKH